MRRHSVGVFPLTSVAYHFFTQEVDLLLQTVDSPLIVSPLRILSSFPTPPPSHKSFPPKRTIFGRIVHIENFPS